MKAKNAMALIAAGILLAAFSGLSIAGECSGGSVKSGAGPAIILADAGSGYDTGSGYNESIGSGSMPDTDSNPPAATTDEPSNAPHPGAGSGHDSVLGTGSMEDKPGDINLNSPGGIDPRPGNDGP